MESATAGKKQPQQMPAKHYEAISRPREQVHYASQPAGIPSNRQTNKDASHHFNKSSARSAQAKSASRDSPWAYTGPTASTAQADPKKTALLAATRSMGSTDVRWSRKQSGNRKNLEDKVWEFEGKAAEGLLLSFVLR